MTISVIVPVYNGEKYLHQILEKLKRQNGNDLQFILVNDGSKDRSMEICNEYCQADARFTIINKQNGGICSARNAGLKAATGEWICFVDQDDDIEDGIFGVFHNAISETADMVIAGKIMKIVGGNNNIISERIYSYGDAEVNKAEIHQCVLNTKRNNILSHLWNCCYKREIIYKNNLKFDEQLKFGFEDTLFNFEYAVRCNRIITVNRNVYNYYRRVNSSTSYKRDSQFLDTFNEYTHRINKAVKESYLLGFTPDNIFTYLLMFGINLFNSYKTNVKKKQKEDIERIYSIARGKNSKYKIDRMTSGNRLNYWYLKTVKMFMDLHLTMFALCIINLRSRIKRMRHFS